MFIDLKFIFFEIKFRDCLGWSCSLLSIKIDLKIVIKFNLTKELDNKLVEELSFTITLLEKPQAEEL